MAERNAGTLPEERIEFRIGINLGDVIVRHGQHAHMEIERHSHIIGDKRKVMDATQLRFAPGNRQLTRQGSRCSSRNGTHPFLSSASLGQFRLEWAIPFI
jgi:hypothetical protein